MKFILFFIVFIVFIILSKKLKKKESSKFNVEENNPTISTDNYDIHIKRLNKFRESNYKGITYYFGAKGSIYYYSKESVRIYL